MAQVQNLLDLFRKNLPDAQSQAGSDAKPAPKPVTGSGAAGKSARKQGDLLPMDATASRGESSHSPASFQTKMEKSAAKLAAKDRAQKPAETRSRGAASTEARVPKAKTDSAPPRNEETKRAPESHDGRPARAQARQADQADRDRAEAVKAQGRNDDQARDPDRTSPDTSAVRQNGSGQEEKTGGLDEKSKAAIKKGLADLGIQVDDKQLEDPAFLADILRLLQAMPAQTLPSEDDPSADAAPDGSEEMPVDGTAAAVQIATTATATADMGTPKTAADPENPAAQTQSPVERAAAKNAVPQSEGPKTLSRKELAGMLENRIAGLERVAQAQANRIQVSAQAPTITPKEWQGVQARPQAEGPSPEPMPIADLDRLRVMQASALQSAPSKNDATGPRTALVLESDSHEPASEPAAAGAIEAGRDASPSRDQDSQTDLFGRNGDQATGAQNIVPKDGAQAGKDAAAGSQFHQVLDQTRGIEHRASPGAEAAPRTPLHDPAVLDQIARKMSLTSHKAGDEINIQLSPEHLGKVRVSLEMKEDGMTARIAVENESVRKQVEDNISSLKDALKEQGIRLQGMEVSVDQRHSSLFNPDGSNAESFFRRQGRGDGQGYGSSGIDDAGLEAGPETDTGRRWGYNTLEFIG